ncbi:MAG: glycerol-3-phosphate 1-O-acyltransferase PlsY [Fimbriimonadaceae bacterium]|nr:glycerol-3-phosphate 1-O-acyltransferase PlsY [Fimbriimonadaceae bacterium]
MSWELYAALLFASFWLGSVPFGLLVAKAKGVDIRKVGSGNIGATNVKRALGDRYFYLVFALDMLKGLVPSLVARGWIQAPYAGIDPPVWWFLAGFMAVLGHAFSPFLGFKGGKGVSTAMGAGLGAVPLVALSCFGVFALVLFASQFMAVASMVGIATSLIFGAVYPNESRQMLTLYLILAAGVIALHRKNIQRLRAGTEPRFRLGRSKTTES